MMHDIADAKGFAFSKEKTWILFVAEAPASLIAVTVTIWGSGRKQWPSYGS